MKTTEQLQAELGQRRYLTDGGLETTLIFLQGIELTAMAAFPLLESEAGRDTLRSYYRSYAAMAGAAGMGFVFEAPTWRANPVWGETLGYDGAALERINRQAVAFMQALCEEFGGAASGHLVSGCVGPRGDGYVADHAMDAAAARDYHGPQLASFAAAGADLTTAMTFNYPEEAIGLVLAGRDCAMPVVISFTTETDGRLPDGTALGEAIRRVDEATGGGPLHYMINCAHPEHFSDALAAGEGWPARLGGLRVNASRLSHAELDNAEELDAGDPEELGRQCLELQRRMPHIRVLGGCCGTDARHVGQMCGPAS